VASFLVSQGSDGSAGLGETHKNFVFCAIRPKKKTGLNFFLQGVLNRRMIGRNWNVDEEG
jgi:hypothetical protein